MTDTYTPPLNVPVRFLAMTWDAGWENDRPTILLEPIQRFSPHDQTCESLIEDEIVDILIEEEVLLGRLQDDLAFRAHHWSWKRLYRIASEVLKGREFPKRGYHVEEQWVEFYRDSEGELECRESKPAKKSEAPK